MTTADASAIYQREKAKYIERRGIDRVALMQVRKPRKRKRLKAPQGLNNLKVYVPSKRREMSAKRRKLLRAAWKEQKRRQRSTPAVAA